MADSKLSALSAAGAYDDADLLYIVQGGVSYKTTYGALKAAIMLAKYPEVANFAALPAAGDHTGETYVCLAAQGTYFINRKPSGFYYSDGASWTYVGDLPSDYFTDSILQISDDSDPTKICKFQLSSISAATTRTLTVPDASGTIVLADATQTITNKSIVASQLTGIIADARMPDLTGDVTTSEGAVATTIANGAVSLAKMANLAQDQFIGRTTASTGVPETATITAAARTVLDDTTVAAMVDTLGGAAATGTGGIARATSPTFVTPALGTPSALVLTNATGGVVAGGGTGIATTTAYSPIFSGTTATGAFKADTGPGTSGHVLTSNGAGAYPTWQAAASGGGVQYFCYVGTGLSLGDATTYYYANNTSWLAATPNVASIIIPRSGNITRVEYNASYAAAGSNEDVNHYVRINDTTDTCNAVADYDSANLVSNAVWTGTQAVTAGDRIIIKVVTPAWGTNPTTIKGYAVIFFTP